MGSQAKAPLVSQRSYHLASTETSVLAGAGPQNAQLPTLPDEGDDTLMEIWLRTTPGEALLLNILWDWERAYDLLREFLPEEEAKTIAKKVSVIRKDGWSVIQIGKPAPESSS